MAKFLEQLWKDEGGQDIAEYAVMLAVILVIVVGLSSWQRYPLKRYPSFHRDHQAAAIRHARRVR